MPFNGTGTFNPLPPPTFPAVTGTVISSTKFNATITDLAGGLSDCVTRDGQSPPTANLPMGGFKLVGLANGSNSTDSCTYGQMTAAVAAATPAATESVVGVLRFATSAEVLALANNAIGISPAELGTLSASSTQRGISRFATAVETQALTRNDVGVTPGDLGALLASETQQGIARFATAAETQALAANNLFISPFELNTLNASLTQKGILKTAAGSDVTTGTSTTLAVTPKALADAGYSAPAQARGWITFDSTGAIISSFGLGGFAVVRNSTGNYTIGWANAFSDSKFAWSGSSTGGYRESSRTSSSLQIITYDPSNGIALDEGPNSVILFH